MKLTYTPKQGQHPPSGWPAADHDEPDAKLAEEKAKSGFYRKAVERREKTGDKEA